MSSPRVAIVTGSAQGIGRGIALQLADDGLDVVVSDVASKQTQIDAVVAEIEAKGRRSVAIPCDVSSEADVKSLVKKTVSELGGLDVMVANAGIAILGPMTEVTMGDFDRIVSTNLKGVFMCIQAAAKVMIEQKRGGRIVAASSVVGKKGSAGSSIYSSTKFAVRGLIQSSACELGSFGITVNGYAPGVINTPMAQASLAEAMKDGPEEFYKRVHWNPAIMKFGEPKDIAGCVSFLASEKASFITGQCISVDGGLYFD